MSAGLAREKVLSLVKQQDLNMTKAASPIRIRGVTHSPPAWLREKAREADKVIMLRIGR